MLTYLITFAIIIVFASWAMNNVEIKPHEEKKIISSRYVPCAIAEDGTIEMVKKLDIWV